MNSIIETAKKRNIKKCLLITPYNNNLGEKIKEELNNSNIKVTRMLNLNLINTGEYFEFGLNELRNYILKNYTNSDENIIISCTNLPTLSIINELEKELKTNVISSNSSMFEQIINDVLGGKYD